MTLATKLPNSLFPNNNGLDYRLLGIYSHTKADTNGWRQLFLCIVLKDRDGRLCVICKCFEGGGLLVTLNAVISCRQQVHLRPMIL